MPVLLSFDLRRKFKWRKTKLFQDVVGHKVQLGYFI